MKRFLLYSVLFIVGLLSNISLSAQQSDTSQAQLKVVNANIQCPFEGNSQIYFLSLQHRKARIYRSCSLCLILGRIPGMPELSYPTAGRYNIRSWILAPKYTKIAEKNLSSLVIRLGLELRLRTGACGKH